MDMSDMSPGRSATGIYIAPNYDLAKMYWMFVGGAIAIATATNLKEYIEYKLRMSDARKSRPDPARPKNSFSDALATMTAITREFCYYSIPLIPSSDSRRKKGWGDKVLKLFPRLSRLPPFGHILLICSNLALLLGITFYGFDVQNPWSYEDIATRAGWMTLTQLPLVFLLAGKASIVGFLTGMSYERLNWIHRSIARCMLVLSAVHMSYFMRSWARFDYITIMFQEDIISRRGLGAFCVLSWQVVSSFAPIRGWCYEVFFIQHMISAVGFLVIVWLHIPIEAEVYIWFPVAVWSFDRVVRFVFLLYNNLSLFHKNESNSSSTFACKAVFHPLQDRATRITVKGTPIHWRPGQHAFVSCHSLVPFQSHPFTISSIPSDGHLEFVVRAHTGGTRKFHRHACQCLPPQSDECRTVFLDGPYGRIRPLEQFDTVVLLAGGTGASFCIPLFRDLVHLKISHLPLVTRRVRFVWAVKSRGQVSWFSHALGESLRAIEGANGLEIDVSIYVTCDPSLTAETTRSGSPASAMDLETVNTINENAEDDGNGCCCMETVKDEDAVLKLEEKLCRCSLQEKSGENKPDQRSSSEGSSVQGTFKLPESVKFVTGRPNIRAVVLKELEHAFGESAVVVCGPHGLVEATKTDVVELSDERAVHKGTGAQGIYLHTESFSW